MRRLLVILSAGAVLALWPTAANAGTSKGVVIGTQGHALLVSMPNGLVRAFGGHAALGSQVLVSGGRIVVVGRVHTARIRGIVVRTIGKTTFLSSNRHLVAVHDTRALASASDTSPQTPAPGDTVSTQVTIENGELDEQNEDDLGPAASGTVQVQAVVTAIGNGTVTLTVNGQSLTVPLPSGLTLPASLVGQTVTLSISLAGNANQGAGEDDQGENDDGGHDGGGDS
jgi:hypothetical protein